MNILVIFTGGTIGSSVNDGFISPNDDNKWKLINMYREKTNDSQELDIETPYFALSENLNGEYLTKLIKCLAKNLVENKYDGIIITHGTDTLQYTAAMLKAVFKNIETPVVLVSANYPLDDERSNGIANFERAVSYIKSKGETGVFVSYKNADTEAKIYQANKLLSHHIYSDEIVELTGEVDEERFSVNINPQEIELTKESPILYLKAYPGCRYIQNLEGIKAIIFGSYHSGTLPTDNEGLKELCGKAKESDIPMYISGMPQGAGYESTKYYKELGINVLPYGTDIDWYMRLWLYYTVK